MTQRSTTSDRVIAAVGEEHQTDAAFAEKFAATHGLDFRYDHRRGVWLHFRSPRWRPDVDGEVYRCAIQFIRDCQADAVDIVDREHRKKALDFAMRAESKAAIDRLVGLARYLRPIADAGEGWDRDPWLLGVLNGVVDLRTGELRPGDPADRITMSTGAAYVSGAECPRWWQFLAEIFGGDEALIDFVWRFVGYTVSGMTSEQILALFYGRGGNGKSVFLDVVAFVLGDYAHNLPFSTIELKQRASIPNDLAALERRRFVTASETNDGTRLNEARIKALTGCDQMTARFLHGEWFSFRPVAKFVLAVNHKPVVRDDSPGFWRRIRLVPFLQSFEGRRRDDGLAETLKAEAPGILAWAVHGCLEWQRRGLDAPAVVTQATGEYREDSDPLAEFLVSCCEAEPDAVTKAGAAQEAYARWAETQRLDKGDRLSAKDFSRRLGERFPRRHTREGWHYDGLRVVTGRLW